MVEVHIQSQVQSKASFRIKMWNHIKCSLKKKLHTLINLSCSFKNYLNILIS